MDRALRANVITKSGKAVETAGDIDTLLLDKTGTITIGNRKATKFHSASGVDENLFVEACLLSSLSDEKSLEEKLKVIKENQLAGVAEWSLGMEGSGVWDLILQYVN